MFLKFNLFKKRDLASLAIAASIIAGGIAIANSSVGKSSPLENSMAAYVVQTDQHGKEILKQATEVAPGQVVEYELVYKNNGDSALKDLVITGPVPGTTQYLSRSAITAAKAKLQVSIDGGNKFESEPVKRIVTDASGKKVEKIIPPSEYTHVRWTMQQPLAAGETQKFAYRSIVK